jgi:hypothetical protein
MAIQTSSEIAAGARTQSAAVPFGHFKDVRQSFMRPGQAPLVAIEGITFDLKTGDLVTFWVRAVAEKRRSSRSSPG